MCSIIFNHNKINRNLISIIGEYLLISNENVKNNYSKLTEFKDSYSDFLKQYYLILMKRRFPQKDYKIDNEGIIIFNIENVYKIIFKDPIYTENYHIKEYIIMSSNCICFINYYESYKSYNLIG